MAMGLCLGLASSGVEAELVRWVNPLGGDWTEASNWDTGVIPGLDDMFPRIDYDVEILVEGDATVSVRRWLSPRVRTLTLGSAEGTLTLDLRRYLYFANPVLEIPESVVITGGSGAGLVAQGGIDRSVVNRGTIDSRFGTGVGASKIVNHGTLLAAGSYFADLENYGLTSVSRGRSRLRVVTNFGLIELDSATVDLWSDQPLRNFGTVAADGDWNRIEFAMINDEEGEVLIAGGSTLTVPALRSEGLVRIGHESRISTPILGEFGGRTELDLESWGPSIRSGGLIIRGPLIIDVDRLAGRDGAFLDAAVADDMEIDPSRVEFTGQMRYGAEPRLEILENYLPPGAFGTGADILRVRFVRPCVADLTDNTMSGFADGQVTGADLSLFVELWLQRNLFADLTSRGTNPGDAGYGTGDLFLDGADLMYFVEAWLAGCP